VARPAETGPPIVHEALRPCKSAGCAKLFPGNGNGNGKGNGNGNGNSNSNSNGNGNGSTAPALDPEHGRGRPAGTAAVRREAT
jgi:hypothetical protein